MMTDAVTMTRLDDGAIWRVTFARSPGNVLDRAMMTELRRVFRDAQSETRLTAICLEGAGADFSFGASVPEHLPEQVGELLPDFRALVLELLDSAVVVVAAFRGRCLGGGLELATVCHRVCAAADAQFGQPEISLGVFAPLASIVLPDRIGRACAEDLCLTGRIVDAPEAREIGLIDEISTGDPAEAAIAWVRRHLSSKSATSLRFAVKAIRRRLAARIREELPLLEELYLRELMASSDAVEGLRAFLEKRQPRWRNS